MRNWEMDSALKCTEECADTSDCTASAYVEGGTNNHNCHLYSYGPYTYGDGANNTRCYIKRGIMFFIRFTLTNKRYRNSSINFKCLNVKFMFQILQRLGTRLCLTQQHQPVIQIFYLSKFRKNFTNIWNEMKILSELTFRKMWISMVVPGSKCALLLCLG